MFVYPFPQERGAVKHIVDEVRDLEYRIVAVYTHGEFRKGAVLRVGERWVPLYFEHGHPEDPVTGESYLLYTLKSVGKVYPNLLGDPLEGWEERLFTPYVFSSEAERQAITLLAIEAVLCAEYLRMESSVQHAREGQRVGPWMDEKLRVVVPPDTREWRVSDFIENPGWSVS